MLREVEGEGCSSVHPRAGAGEVGRSGVRRGYPWGAAGSPPQLWVLGPGSVFGALRVLRCPIPLFPALCPLFISLHLAAEALSHAGAFFFSSSSFFSPLRLRQAHKMCKCFIFSLSVCFGFGIFYFFILFFSFPCLFCRAGEDSLSLVFSYVCVFNALGTLRPLSEPPHSTETPQAPPPGCSSQSH